MGWRSKIYGLTVPGLRADGSSDWADDNNVKRVDGLNDQVNSDKVHELTV